MQNHKLKFHSSCFFKFSNFCKISRAPAISLQAAANFPAVTHRNTLPTAFLRVFTDGSVFLF